MIHRLPLRLLTLLLFALLLVPTAALQAQPAPPPLLIDVPADEGRQPLAAHARRGRLVRIDYRLLGGRGAAITNEYGAIEPAPRLELNLFADTTLIAELEALTPLAGRPGFVWQGRLAAPDQGLVILSVDSGQLFGYVQANAQTFTIQPAADLIHEVVEIDQTAFVEVAEDGLVAPAGPQPNLPAQAPEDDGSIIDVMIVYTADALAAIGGELALPGYLASIEATTNAAYSNSGITPRIRVVYSHETVYTESGNSSTDLNRLSINGDGFMDEIHTLRATYGADLVALITATLDACGRGWLYNGFSNAAFTVTEDSCAVGNLSFPHELGHNMGARHDWYMDATTGSAPGGLSDNHGRAYVAGSWRTVMAYDNFCADNEGGCTRLPYFSNPGINYLGVPTGFVAGTNSSCSAGNTGNPDCDADNARVLDATASTVANFEQEQVLTSLTATASSASVRTSQAVTYTLTVNNGSSTTASGVVITATVPANTTLIPASLSGDASTSGNSAGSTIVWTIAADLTPGSSLERTFVISASSNGLALLETSVGASNGVTMVGNDVETTIIGAAGCGYFDGFENGALGSAWTTFTSNEGRVEVGSTDPHQGSYSLLLDDYDAGINFSNAAAILSLDLTGETVAWLEFWWREWGDETHPGLEGVFISDDDGASWSLIHSLSGNGGIYEFESLDLVTLASGAGLTLNDQFQIKFQFYDDFPIGTDGYGIDDVYIRCDAAGVTVWDGGGSTNNWSEAANWNPDVVPNGGSVLFDGSSSKNAVIDASFANDIADLTLSSGYTGTLTQDSSLLVTNNLNQLGGTFVVHGSDPLDVNGLVYHSGGIMRQSRTVNNADVPFLELTNAAGSLIKYRGLDLDTSGNGNDLGLVTVNIEAVDNALGGYCTSDGSGSPPYVFRCFEISPTNNLAAQLTLWSWGDELSGIAETDLAVYRFANGTWLKLTSSVSTGNDGAGYAYVSAATPGFSSFLMGNDDVVPTAIQLSAVTLPQRDVMLPVALLLLTLFLSSSHYVLVWRRRRQRH